MQVTDCTILGAVGGPAIPHRRVEVSIRAPGVVVDVDMAARVRTVRIDREVARAQPFAASIRLALPRVGGRPVRPILSACDHRAIERTSPLVNPKRSPEGPEGSPSTLGDLLYADRSVAAIPEGDWVALVRSIAGGDQRAMRALYERTHRLVFTLAVRISGNRESAEEITLDVFHDVWRRSAHYDAEGGSVVGWIMNQARSRAIDRVRFDRRKKRLPPQPNPGEERQDRVGGPADAVDARQRGGRLREALASLTPDERQAIETAFFGELTYSEAAVRLDQPLGTVKTRVRSGLAKLRKVLGSEGGSS